MTDLTEFLNARLDEEAALAEGGDQRSPDMTYRLDERLEWVSVAPARVLADVESKRRIIALHPHTTQRQQCSETHLRRNYGPHWEKVLKNLDKLYCETCDVEDGMIDGDGRPCLTLRLLALPYASYSGYRPEWAV